tara:strand:+ start:774 stop:1175 length:402 start_codon:yes stop_codon:yes gene_type:complete
MKECPICLKDFDNINICITDCNHEFCSICLNKWLDRNRLDCPKCRKNIKYFNLNENTTRIIEINPVITNQNDNQNNNLMVELNQISSRIRDSQNLININVKLKKYLFVSLLVNITLLTSSSYLYMNDCEINFL